MLDVNASVIGTLGTAGSFFTGTQSVDVALLLRLLSVF